jgi:GGDEF domain-containing protein
MLELAPNQTIPLLPAEGKLSPEWGPRQEKMRQVLGEVFRISPNPGIILTVDTSGERFATDVLFANDAFGQLKSDTGGVTIEGVCTRFAGEKQAEALLNDISNLVLTGGQYCETITPAGKLIIATQTRELDNPDLKAITVCGIDIKSLLADDPNILSTLSSFWIKGDSVGFILNKETTAPVEAGRPGGHTYTIIRTNDMSTDMPFNVTKNPEVLKMLDSAARGEFANDDVTIVDQDGQRKIYRILAYRGELENDQDKYIVNVRDVTDDLRKAKTLENAANYDMVSGLLRRDRMTENIDRLDGVRKEKGLDNLALLFLDVDHFKEVNDTRGHVTGDYYLALIAFVSALSTRGAEGVKQELDRFSYLLDTNNPHGMPYRKAAEYILENYLHFFPKTGVTGQLGGPEPAKPPHGEPDSLARYGGDEFAILLRALNSPQGVIKFIRRFEKMLTEYNGWIDSQLTEGATVPDFDKFSIPPKISISLGAVFFDGKDFIRIIDNKNTANWNGSDKDNDRFTIQINPADNQGEVKLDKMIGISDVLMYENKQRKKAREKQDLKHVRGMLKNRSRHIGMSYHFIKRRGNERQ